MAEFNNKIFIITIAHSLWSKLTFSVNFVLIIFMEKKLFVITFLQNNTMRIIYMYQSRDPPHGSVQLGTLPDPDSSFRPYHPMVLTQRGQIRFRKDDQIRNMELRNEDVPLPSGDNTLSWCKMFKLEDINRKLHLIRVSCHPSII